MFETFVRDRAMEYAGSDPNGAWPSTVIRLPLDRYFVLDVDSDIDEKWIEEHGSYPRTADAYVLTDDGIQFVWCRPTLPAENSVWHGAQDDNYHELSKGRGWDMRLLSKRQPSLRRSMVGLTERGCELALEWNREAQLAMEEKRKGA